MTSQEGVDGGMLGSIGLCLGCAWNVERAWLLKERQHELN